MMKNQQCYLLVIREIHGFYAWSHKRTVLGKGISYFDDFRSMHFKEKFDHAVFGANLSLFTGC